MDEKQFAAIVERVLARIREETTGSPLARKAYLILPEGWRSESREQCMDMARLLRDAHRTVVVLPDGEGADQALLPAEVVTVRRCEAVFPDEDFDTVFPVASRDLVVKTALCLGDDFSSGWVARCIARGQPVYMRRESPLFTGIEPEAYKRRILSYYRDAAEYGVRFDAFPCAEKLGRPAQNTEGKRIITVEDLGKLQGAGELRLRPGDIVTALAAERAEELGIRILYQ